MKIKNSQSLSKTVQPILTFIDLRTAMPSILYIFNILYYSSARGQDYEADTIASQENFQGQKHYKQTNNLKDQKLAYNDHAQDFVSGKQGNNLQKRFSLER